MLCDLCLFAFRGIDSSPPERPIFAYSYLRGTCPVALHLRQNSTFASVSCADDATTLIELGRFEEAKALLRKTMPVAQRVHDEGHEVNFKLRGTYAVALYADADATLDDLREAVTIFEEIEPTARRVLGGAHLLVLALESPIRLSRKALQTREASPGTA